MNLFNNNNNNNNHKLSNLIISIDFLVINDQMEILSNIDTIINHNNINLYIYGIRYSLNNNYHNELFNHILYNLFLNKNISFYSIDLLFVLDVNVENQKFVTNELINNYLNQCYYLFQQ